MTTTPELPPVAHIRFDDIDRVLVNYFSEHQLCTYAQQCVEAATLPLQARIKELEAQLAAAKSKQFGQQIYKRQV